MPISNREMKKYDDKGQWGKHKEGHLPLDMSEGRLLKQSHVQTES